MGKEVKKSEGKQKSEHLVYVGPTVHEIPIKFGQILTERPEVPKELKEVVREEFFVPLKEFPKAKRELGEKRKEAFRRYLELRRKKEG
ncbi:MAG: hypothetical protein ABGX12_00700 [Desulfurobacteriaceae bacterium]